MSLLKKLLGEAPGRGAVDPTRWWGVRLRYWTLIPLIGVCTSLDFLEIIEIPPLLYLVFAAAFGFALFLHGAYYLRWWPRKLTWLAIAIDSLMIAFACGLTGGPQSPFLLIFVVQVLWVSLLDTAYHAVFSATLAIFTFSLFNWFIPEEVWMRGGTRFEFVVERWDWPWVIAYLGSLLIVVTATGAIYRKKIALGRRELIRKSRELEEAYRQLKTSYGRLAKASENLEHSEKVLQQTEKLSSLGRMAASIAHELNNPLTMISTYCQMLLMNSREHRLDEQTIDKLKKIMTGTDRITEISRSLTSFSRSSPAGKSSVDLNEVLKEALSFTELELRRSRIDIKMDLDPSIPRIYGSKVALSQVVVNLLINAKDALSSKRRKKIFIRTFRTDLREIGMEVRDTGVGIPRDILPKIFEPFFTSKGEGEGTGLGLAIAGKIVNEHGGRISVESEEGRWTQFTIFLPIPEDELQKKVS